MKTKFKLGQTVYAFGLDVEHFIVGKITITQTGIYYNSIHAMTEGYSEKILFDSYEKAEKAMNKHYQKPNKLTKRKEQ